MCTAYRNDANLYFSTDRLQRNQSMFVKQLSRMEKRSIHFRVRREKFRFALPFSLAKKWSLGQRQSCSLLAKRWNTLERGTWMEQFQQPFPAHFPPSPRANTQFRFSLLRSFERRDENERRREERRKSG